ncbi:phosphatidylethanolamine N-methyltransferase [Flavobacteriaceae bacterium UJ101]|nr:phosphatidylethanolamine N-methyltransferase [Flavobacteriaceae bacterium UJ101]
MKVNTNHWNKIRYTFYQPFYDIMTGIFKSYRKKSINQLALNSNDKILILGAGTGLDLPFLKNQKNITAIDITPSMLKKLDKRGKKYQLNVDSHVMDGQNLAFENNTFDCVILHLVIAVIPDPVKTIQEVERVLKPNGKYTILDKFISKNSHPSFIRKLLNPITNFLFSNINRDIHKIISNTNLIIKNEQNLNLSFKIIQGIKP